MIAASASSLRRTSRLISSATRHSRFPSASSRVTAPSTLIAAISSSVTPTLFATATCCVHSSFLSGGPSCCAGLLMPLVHVLFVGLQIRARRIVLVIELELAMLGLDVIKQRHRRHYGWEGS